jgi:hypothetical protein
VKSTFANNCRREDFAHRGAPRGRRQAADLRFRSFSPIRESKALLGPVFSCPHGPKSRFPPPGVTARKRADGQRRKERDLDGGRDRGMAPELRFCGALSPPVRIELRTARLQGGLAYIRGYSPQRRKFGLARENISVRVRGYPPVLSQCLPRLVTTS